MRGWSDGAGELGWSTLVGMKWGQSAADAQAVTRERSLLFFAVCMRSGNPSRVEPEEYQSSNVGFIFTVQLLRMEPVCLMLPG